MPSLAATKRAILHLSQLADTDIFPPLFEFKFYAEQVDDIAAKFENLSFGEYRPKSCFEILSPKTRLSFRIAHQLYPLDTLLYTAAVIDIAESIESLRLPVEEGPFSYRFVNESDSAQLYSTTSNYHDWLLKVKSICEKENPFDDDKIVIETDISDFYSRIYFHRIEHILDDCNAANSVRKIIEGIIKHSRANQSHGLPVGTAASRLLAEGLLNDTDRMLSVKDQRYARYVDDFRIVVGSENKAHSTLCRLAEHLMVTEGLSLNAAKTKITSAEEQRKIIEERLDDVLTSSEYAYLNKYFSLVYDGEDVSVEDIDGISGVNLIDHLEKILKRDSIDYTSVKVILKAMRAVDIDSPLEIVSKFSELLYYTPRDFCNLLGTLAQKHVEVADALAEKVVEVVKKPPFSDMALCRLWVGHLFVAQALPITHELLSDQNLTRNVIEKRQSLLLKALLKDRAFFRDMKTKFDEVSDWEKSALLIGMSCLAKSEYEVWLGVVKAKYNDLLSDNYFKWLKENREILLEKIRADFTFGTVKKDASKFSDLIFGNGEPIDDLDVDF